MKRFSREAIRTLRDLGFERISCSARNNGHHRLTAYHPCAPSATFTFGLSSSPRNEGGALGAIRSEARHQLRQCASAPGL